MNEIKFVYFDLGGVFFRWQPAFERLTAISKRTLKEVKSVFNRYDGKSILDEMSTQDLWKKYQEELSFSYPQIIDFMDFWTDSFIKIPESYENVQTVHNVLPVGLITNAYRNLVSLATKKGYLPDLQYEAVIESWHVKKIKPHDDIYLLAEKSSGYNPNNLLFIDDAPENITAAKKRGWNTVQFDEHNPHISWTQIFSLLNIKK